MQNTIKISKYIFLLISIFFIIIIFAIKIDSYKTGFFINYENQNYVLISTLNYNKMNNTKEIVFKIDGNKFKSKIDEITFNQNETIISLNTNFAINKNFISCNIFIRKQLIFMN